MYYVRLTKVNDGDDDSAALSIVHSFVLFSNEILRIFHSYYFPAAGLYLRYWG